MPLWLVCWIERLTSFPGSSPCHGGRVGEDPGNEVVKRPGLDCGERHYNYFAYALEALLLQRDRGGAGVGGRWEHSHL